MESTGDLWVMKILSHIVPGYYDSVRLGFLSQIFLQFLREKSTLAWNIRLNRGLVQHVSSKNSGRKPISTHILKCTEWIATTSILV